MADPPPTVDTSTAPANPARHPRRRNPSRPNTGTGSGSGPVPDGVPPPASDRPPRNNGHRRPNHDDAGSSRGGRGGRRPPAARGPQAGGESANVNANVGEGSAGDQPRPVRDSRRKPAQNRPPRNDTRRPPPSSSDGPAADRDQPGPSNSSRNNRGPPRQNRRAAKFNTSLSETPQATKDSTEHTSSQRYSHPALKEDDLTSILIKSLSTHPFPDCPICFNAIHPAQPSWSCSPSMPAAGSMGDKDDEEGAGVVKGNENAQCCWTTFHLKCIKSWAHKSVKDIEEAWRARGEVRKGSWRCPGCQTKREEVPQGYRCVHSVAFFLGGTACKYVREINHVSFCDVAVSVVRLWIPNLQGCRRHTRVPTPVHVLASVDMLVLCHAIQAHVHHAK